MTTPVEHQPRRPLAARLHTVDGLMSVVASALLPLGLLVILLGWYGAAHTPYLFEQLPYLISGGLVGLGLLVGGGLLFFGSWVARAAGAQQQASEELAGLLREIRDELAARPAAQEPAPRPRRAGRTNSNGSGSGNGHGAFVATAHGSMLHRPDCSVVVGREDLHGVGPSSGLQPCGLCDPLSATAS